jgi:hypothetical protein
MAAGRRVSTRPSTWFDARAVPLAGCGGLPRAHG